MKHSRLALFLFFLLTVAAALLLSGCLPFLPGSATTEATTTPGTDNATNTTVSTPSTDPSTPAPNPIPETPEEFFVFDELQDGTYAVAKYIGSALEVCVPSTYQGKPVTEIGERAFYECWDLTSITLPESITRIGTRAFAYCTSLTSFTIPSRVTSIGSFAFCYCINFTSITIPSSITVIGSDAFGGCLKLIEIYNRSALTITVGEKTPGYAGYYAKNVYTTTSGASKLHTVGDYLFYAEDDAAYLMAYLGNDTAITLPESYLGKDYEIYTYALAYRTNLKNVTIPDCISSIGDAAFYSCKSLISITIPDRITRIADSTFFDCSGLLSITIGNGVTGIGSFAFNNCYRLVEICNKSQMTITKSSSIGKYALNIYTPTSGASKLHTAGDYLFYEDGDTVYLVTYLGSETALTLPADYQGKNYAINRYAFRNCTGLTSITIPDSVTSIGNSAFVDCTSLTSVVFEDPNNWYALNELMVLNDPEQNAEYLTGYRGLDAWEKRVSSPPTTEPTAPGTSTEGQENISFEDKTVTYDPSRSQRMTASGLPAYLRPKYYLVAADGTETEFSPVKDVGTYKIRVKFEFKRASDAAIYALPAPMEATLTILSSTTP